MGDDGQDNLIKGTGNDLIQLITVEYYENNWIEFSYPEFVERIRKMKEKQQIFCG